MTAMSTQVVPPSTEDCHFVTDPVWPDRVKVPLFVPLHTVVFEETDPPTDVFTVTVTVEELTGLQFPLCTTALK